jgi:hypothetical protein
VYKKVWGGKRSVQGHGLEDADGGLKVAGGKSEIEVVGGGREEGLADRRWGESRETRAQGLEDFGCETYFELGAFSGRRGLVTAGGKGHGERLHLVG